MTQEPPTNFNREIDLMLNQATERVEHLRDLNRPLRPWEKEKLKERLMRLESQETWDKANIEKRLTALKKELRTIYLMSSFVLLILLGMCILLGFGLGKTFLSL